MRATLYWWAILISTVNTDCGHHRVHLDSPSNSRFPQQCLASLLNGHLPAFLTSEICFATVDGAALRQLTPRHLLRGTGEPPQLHDIWSFSSLMDI